MSRKKVATGKSAEHAPEAAPAEAQVAFWPSSFRPPRQTAWAAAGFVVFTLLLFSLANINGLLWMKSLFGAALGLSPPVLDLKAQCWDLAAVLWMMAFVLTSAWVHPALGLGALLLLRTPLDGYVYPTDNAYFLWGIAALSVTWVWKSRRAAAHAPLPVMFWLLALFVLVALAGSAASTNIDHTARGLMLWTGYVLLFWLAFHVGRERSAWNWVLTALIAAAAAQAFYSILHFEYVLPHLRHLIGTSREARLMFFGEDAMSPERLRRFNVNRAFGSMLFPNSLAGFLILAIPATAAAGLGAIRAWRAPLQAGDAPVPASGRQAALGCGALTWLAFTVSAFTTVEFRIAHAIRPLYWYEKDALLGSLICILALIPAGWVFHIVRRRPLARAGALFGAVGLPILLLMELYTLWITYSRGAMLALAMAVAVAALLVVMRRMPWTGSLLARLPAALALLAVAAVMAAALAQTLHNATAAAQAAPPAAPESAAPAQAAPPAPGPIENRQILEQGADVGTEALLDPESFRLRLTYWRVGWRMFAGNPWAGVGLGNFGLAYPRYQSFQDADVKEAHNGYVQMLSETGLFGGLVFTAVWAVFLLGGAARLLREQRAPEFLIQLSLYTGLLAFLIHAGIDIHFSHPSLVMLALVVAALFYARGGHATTLRPGRVPSALSFLVLPLALTVLIAAFTLPPFLHDLALSRLSFINVDGGVGDKDIAIDMSQRLGTAQVLLDAGPKYAREPQGKQPPQLAFAAALALIPNEKTLTGLGAVYAPLPKGGGMRKLNDTEDIPGDSVLLLQRPRDAFGHALAGAQARVAELERIDARYPRSPELAVHIAQWCELMTRHSNAAKYDNMRIKYADKMLVWAAAAVKRNPFSADAHGVLAFMCWAHANADLGTGRMQKVQRCLEEYTVAARLSPLTTNYLEQQARVLQYLAASDSQTISQDDKARYAKEAADLQARIASIIQQRSAAGLPL